MTHMPEFSDPAAVQLPAVVQRNVRTVERGFWTKLLYLTGRIPFAEEAAAAYFWATASRTPARVRRVMIAAPAYFVIPTDAVPDFIAGLGFTDDAAVLATAIGLVSGHVKPRHHVRARATLGLPEPIEDEA